MMGELAEQWTARELRKFRRHGWRLLNHGMVGLGDTDHVLIGPGGIFVVETKWRSSGWRFDRSDAYVGRAVEQVGRSTRQLRAWAPLRKLGDIPIHPVVVLWEPTDADHASGDVLRTIGDTTVMTGQALGAWRAAILRETGLVPIAVDAVWDALVRQTRMREENENATRPMPRSAENLVLRMVTLLGVLTGGLLAASAVPPFVRPTWLWWPLWIGEFVVGAILCRQRTTVWYGRALVGGIAAMLLLLAASTIAVAA